MSWNDKSNYEINKSVASLWLPCDYRFVEEEEAVLLTGVETWLGAYGEPDEREVICGEFDPCTNIQDAWPIMKEYCIDIYWPDYGNCFGTVARYIEEGTVDVAEDFTDKEDVLRCAMIVYLESEGVSCE
jgi:hypothetical protein